MSDPRSLADLAPFERVLSRTKRRVRTGRALRALVVGTAVTGTAAVLGHAAGIELTLSRVLGVVGLAALPTLVCGCWPVSSERAARLLDRAHDAHGRASAGVEFMTAPNAQRTAFMAAHLRELGRRAGAWSAAQAVPLRRPRELPLLLLPLLAWLGVAPWRPPEPAPFGATLTVEKGPAISQGDLAAFRDDARKLANAPGAAQRAGDVRLFNELLEQLATGELSRSEGIRALLTLERKLLAEATGAETSDAERARLGELADDFARVSKALSEALRSNQPDVAAQALRALSRQAQENARTKEELKRALAQERARLRAEEAQAARAQELEGLLKKPPPPNASAGERSLFERRKRELDRLRRELSERQASARRLETLSRDLADAREAFANGATDEALRALEAAARALEQFAEQKRANQGARELAREASQLREHLQRNAGEGSERGAQASASGAARDQRRQRFMLRARGEQADERHALSLQKGASSDQAGPQGAPGGGAASEQQRAANQPGEAQGARGRGEGAAGERAAMLAPGRSAQDAEQIELVVPLPARGASLRVEGAGHERGAPPLPSPTSLKATHTDSAVAGIQGKGPTRSQVILDAADRGFRDASYQKVYADYRSHAESVIERDQVPQGHRFYVRRYFQLIRPRDE